MANATATLVAQSIGAGNYQLARKISFSGQRLAVYIAILVAIGIWIFQDSIVLVYTSDAAIIENAIPLLVFVCIYQIFDALQVTSSHILRAHKVVLAPTLLYFISFWCIGLGGGLIFAFNLFELNLPSRITGAGGFWFSSCISLAFLAALLLVLMKRVQKRSEEQAA
jgi:MATE family multidrug resistance protein